MDLLEELARLAPESNPESDGTPFQQQQVEVVQEGEPLVSAQELSDSQVDAKFSEAETRLEKAMLYRQWITGDLFDGDSDAVREVTTEFQGFAQQQLRKLLGIEQEVQEVVVKSYFSPQEILILKTLAGQILNNPKLAPKKQENTQTPTLVAQKPAPVAVTAKLPAKKPQLKQRKVPQEMQVAAPEPPKPAPVAPVVKPAPQKPVVNSSAPAKPEGALSDKVKASLPQKSKAPEGPDQVFQQDGRTYKATWVPMNPGEYGPVEKQRIDNMKPETYITLRNNIQVVKTIEGETFKVINKDTTPRKPEKGAVPFPDLGQMAYITAQNAGAAADRNMRQLDSEAGGRPVDRAQGAGSFSSGQYGKI